MITSMLIGTLSRQRAENFAQRQRAFTGHPARADAGPPGDLQVGLARREHPVAHLRIGKAPRIHLAQIGARALGADEMQRIDENRNFGAAGLRQQVERLGECRERAVGTELDDRGETGSLRDFAKPVERGAQPCPIRIVALRQRVRGSQFGAQRERGLVFVHVRFGQQVEREDIQQLQTGVGERSPDVTDECRIPNDRKDRKPRRFLQPQAHAGIARVARDVEKRERRDVHQHARRHVQLVHARARVHSARW